MPTRQLEDAKRKHERRLESIESILSSRDRGPFVDEQEFGAIVRWYFDDLSPASVAEALRVATEARDGDQHLDGVDPDAEEIWSALRRLGSDCSAALLLRAPEHSES